MKNEWFSFVLGWAAFAVLFFSITVGLIWFVVTTSEPMFIKVAFGIVAGLVAIVLLTTIYYMQDAYSEWRRAK